MAPQVQFLGFLKQTSERMEFLGGFLLPAFKLKHIFQLPTRIGRQDSQMDWELKTVCTWTLMAFGMIIIVPMLPTRSLTSVKVAARSNVSWNTKGISSQSWCWNFWTKYFPTVLSCEQWNEEINFLFLFALYQLVLLGLKKMMEIATNMWQLQQQEMQLKLHVWLMVQTLSPLKTLLKMTSSKKSLGNLHQHWGHHKTLLWLGCTELLFVL